MRQTGFSGIVIIILVGLLLLSISFFYYKSSPITSESTQNQPQTIFSPHPSPLVTNDSWQTYIDKENGFQIDYPAYYQNIPKDEYSDEGLGLDITNKPNPDRGLYAIGEDLNYHEISTRVTPTEQSLNEIGKEMDRYSTREEYMRKQIQVDGHQAYYLRGIGIDARNILVITIKDKKEYTVNLRYFKDDPESEVVFDRMVKSFKFLENN